MAAWARPLNVETLAPPCRYQAAHCCTRDTLYLHGGGGQEDAEGAVHHFHSQICGL